jgi:uncharacterized membrane protein
MNIDLVERVSSRRAWDPRVAVVSVLVLVFLCGAAAGALAMESGLHSRLHRPSFDTPAGRSINFERLQRDLALSPEQSEQMRSILDDMWQYYRTVLTDTKARVEMILNGDQREKFERILQQQKAN